MAHFQPLYSLFAESNKMNFSEVLLQFLGIKETSDESMHVDHL